MRQVTVYACHEIIESRNVQDRAGYARAHRPAGAANQLPWGPSLRSRGPAPEARDRGDHSTQDFGAACRLLEGTPVHENRTSLRGLAVATSAAVAVAGLTVGINVITARAGEPAEAVARAAVPAAASLAPAMPGSERWAAMGRANKPLREGAVIRKRNGGTP